MSATLTIQFELDDYAAALALDGETGLELLDKVGVVIKKLRAMDAKPITAAGNGGTAGQAEALPGTKVCPIHSVAMKRRTGQGGDVWYSHKAIAPDGQEYWCRGTERK